MNVAKTTAIVAVVMTCGMAMAQSPRSPRRPPPRVEVAPATDTNPLSRSERANQWSAVDDSIRRGLPLGAIAALGPIVEGALRDSAWAEATRAIAQRIALESNIQGNKPEERIRRMEAELAAAPAPMRPVLEAILAEWFWQYFAQNRWRFVHRTQTSAEPGDDFTTWDLRRIYAKVDRHFQNALAARELLRAAPIEDWSMLLETGNAPVAYRPTLYDFVAHQALAFYASGEQGGALPEDAFEIAADTPILGPAEEFVHWRVASTDSGSPKFAAIRIYQELLRFHAGDRDRSASIDADLWRLVYAKNTAYGEEKNRRFKLAMEHIATRYPRHELSARAYHEWAATLHEEGDLLEARRVAARGERAFGESIGGRRCYNLIQQIEARELSCATERVWNAPLPTIDLRYRNLDQVHLRLVPVDFDARMNRDGRWPGGVDREELLELLKLRPVREWSADLPPTPDYRERLERLPAPAGIEPGCYALLVADDSDFDPEAPLFATILWVSDLALVLEQGDGAVEGFVLHAVSGDPIPNAEVQCWTNGRGEWSRSSTTRTDRNGRFHVERAGEHFYVVARSGRQRLASLYPIQADYRGRRSSYDRTLFFTDRALYRPGQTIRYKGLCIHAGVEDDRYETIPGRSVTVVFRDVNRKEIERRTHRTNDYGSFSGSFVAPASTLLGHMTISVDEDPRGQTSVTVEEYKRPKFQVSLEAPATPARLDGDVTLAGKAVAYTGAPTDGAQVRWRVTREARYPYWWSWRYSWRVRPTRAAEIAHGSATTGADGAFTVTFTAKPDPTADAEGSPIFRYTLYADVTDPAGETRSAQRTMSVGSVALEAGLSAASWQTHDRPVEITISTATPDGVPLAAKGTLRVRRLERPGASLRPRLVNHDFRYEYHEGFGDRREPDPADPANWPDGPIVHTSSVTTDSGGRAVQSVRLGIGIHRAQFETRDRHGAAVQAELQITVVDPEAMKLGLPVANHLDAPAWSVEPGDEFTALWGTGYDRGLAFVEIEHRGQVLQSFWTSPARTQTVVRQRVTEAMRGGFTLRVTAVRENRAYLHAVRVDVPWSNKRLAVKWERLVSKLEPGQRETWTAVITGPDATRAAAEMVATLYDASLDAYRPNGWMSGFGVFRQEHARPPARFENVLRPLTSTGPGWIFGQRDGTLRYPGYPGSVLWNHHGYGFSHAAALSVTSERRVDEVREMVMAKSSTVAQGGDLHFRGGRGNEVRLSLDGVAASDAQGGRAGPPAPPAPPDLGQVTARANLQETAFFFPHLIAGENGEVRLEFTMPEALTEWRFFGFAHDRELRSGLLEGRAVTTRDLMVQPNPPRFLREGDVLEFTAKVTNRSDRRQSGSVRLTLANAETGAKRDSALGLGATDRRFDVPAGESRTYSWRLSVPDGAGVLTYKAVAAGERGADGEEGYLPVLSRRVFVTESLPLPIRGAGTRTFDFARLRQSGASGTLRHEALTVQMVSNPAWYAVLALPYLMEFPHECSEQTFNRMYANALARHVAESDPKIAKVFDRWRGTDALDSPLEKNTHLKSVLLDETPWLRQAHAESKARRNVGVLFDKNRLDGEIQIAHQRLAQMQLPDGMWPWFPGGRGNEYITLYITTGFGRLRHLGVDVEQAPVRAALRRLDAWMDEIYRDLLRRGNVKDNHLSTTVALYLYGRSFYLKDHPVERGHREALDYWLGQARQHWLALAHRQSQAHLALALQRFGDRDAARGIMRSIGQRSVRDEELGMYWRELEHSWWWYRAPIETQAMMIEAFAEVMDDSAAVEECKIWLLKQKQTQDWKTTKATADAVYALLLRGTDLLASDALVQVSLAGQKLVPEKVEAGTGFTEHRFLRTEVAPAMGAVKVVKTDPGVAWGSVHWQYLEDMSKVTPYDGTPLDLKKALYTRRASERGPILVPITGPIAPGDELIVRMELRVDRDMEYVHLKDQRGSGSEPVNVLSGYRYQDGLRYYEQTRDTGTHFFIDYLPKGAYVFEYPLRIQHRGRYQTGVAEIQCMYAPEFGGHSASAWLEVK